MILFFDLQNKYKPIINNIKEINDYEERYDTLKSFIKTCYYEIGKFELYNDFKINIFNENEYNFIYKNKLTEYSYPICSKIDKGIELNDLIDIKEIKNKVLLDLGKNFNKNTKSYNERNKTNKNM